MQHEVTLIDVDEHFVSTFSKQTIELSDVNGMFISPRQHALNFRYRKSLPGYESDWHVAGDPTLIIVQQGCIQVCLRSGENRQFAQGDMFIAADYLPNAILPSDIHGHKASVIGQEQFVAVHLKLSKALP